MTRPAELDALLAQHRAGLALPRGFYTSQAIYAHDIARFWNQSWIWVGHVSQIPEPGDYFLFDYAQESIIVVRDREGTVRAHLNLCRHRGSRVCTEASGHARSFVCPYHAWTFELSGDLRAGRAMPADFDPADWGLFPAQVRVFEGLILVSVSPDAPDLEDGLARLGPLMASFRAARMKVVHTARYPVPANWKLALENYMECYHCAPSHLEYARSHTLKAPQDVQSHLPALQERARAIGLPTGEFSSNGAQSGRLGADFYYRRYPLYDGFLTGSRTGAPLAPPLGDLTGHDGGATDVQIGMLNNFLFYADHAVGYRFVPRGLQQTDIEVVWMLRDDAQEGHDYSLNDLIWLWHVTSQDDERIIRHNQEGVNSQFFQPGPLSEMEWGIRSFYENYLAMITR